MKRSTTVRLHQLPTAGTAFLTRHSGRERCATKGYATPGEKEISEFAASPRARISAAFGPANELEGLFIAELGADESRGSFMRLGIGHWAVIGGSAHLIAPLYTLVAADAVSSGSLFHLVECPSDPDLIGAWFRLGFGLEQAYGAMPLSLLDKTAEPLAGVELREARLGDEDTLAGLSQLIAEFQHESPIFAFASSHYRKGLREGFRGLTREAGIIRIAFRGADAIGYQAWFDAGEGTIELGVSAVSPGERGNGIGRALTASCAVQAEQMGFSTVITDWRIANPAASAFWPACGFVEELYRLTRRINPEYASEPAQTPWPT